MAKRKKKWIKGAIKKKGAFTSWCKRMGYGGVNATCIAAGKRSKDPTTRRRANLSSTLGRMRRKKKRGRA